LKIPSLQLLKAAELAPSFSLSDFLSRISIPELNNTTAFDVKPHQFCNANLKQSPFVQEALLLR
jgi:hypothetical protein